MSNLVFPNYLPGVMFTQRKSPTFKTGIHSALTDKESRIAYRAFPTYEWELEYELLRDYADGRANFVPWSQNFMQWSVLQGGTGLAPIVNGNYVSSAAPDGTYTADQIILACPTPLVSTNFAEVRVSLGALPSGTYTASVWMQTTDGSTVQVLFGASGPATGFNAVCTVTPQLQRFSVTGTISNPSGAAIFALLLLGDGFNTSAYANIAAWGAQLENASAPGPYIGTNGAAVVAGDLKSLFGFYNLMLGQQGTFLYQDPDFNTVTLQPFALGNGVTASFQLTAQYMPGNDFVAPFGIAGLPELIQNSNGAPQIYTTRYGGQELLSSGSRTNRLLQSNAFSTAPWSVFNATITAAAATSPDGTADAVSMNEGVVASALHRLVQTFTTVAATPYTASVWLKASTGQFMVLTFDDGGSTNYATATFDLVNGVVSAAPASGGTTYALNAQMQAFPNGWYRCSITGMLTSSTTGRLTVLMSNSGASNPYPSYTGASLVNFLWQGQVETGLVPTASIPTTSTTATNGGSDYTLSATNLVTPASVIASGVQWAWSGSFYYRVRFNADNLDFDEILYQFWELKKLPLKQVKL